MAKIQLYNYQDFVREVQNRLSIMHKIEGYEVGKNRITFSMNGATVTIRKNKDTETKTRKTIVSCAEMFPCVIKNDYDGSLKYTNADVDLAVNSLDSYFIEELGMNPVKSAICSRYHYLKDMLLPLMVYYDLKKPGEINKAREDILADLVFEGTEPESNTNESNVNGTLMAFIGKNINTDKNDRAFIIVAEAYKMTLFSVRYHNGQLTGYEDSDEDIDFYEIPYNKYCDVTGVALIRKLTKTHYAFKKASFKFAPEEVLEENELVKEEENLK